MVIWLMRGANDLHMVQLMPLPSHHLLLHKNPEEFTFFAAGFPRVVLKRSLLSECSSSRSSYYAVLCMNGMESVEPLFCRNARI